MQLKHYTPILAGMQDKANISVLQGGAGQPIVALSAAHYPIESHWVLERTELGREEIATRCLRLPVMTRAVLLMVDGKTEEFELRRRMSIIPNARELLGSLYSQGLIRRRHYTSDPGLKGLSDVVARSDSMAHHALTAMKGKPPGALMPATPPLLHRPIQSSSPGSPRRSLALARLFLLDQMECMLGDRSEVVRNLLRTATTREALLIVLADCREIIEESAGAERALRVASEFHALLPLQTLAHE